MEELRQDSYGWWVVAYSEFIRRILPFLLFEAYDNFRIWAISPDECRLARYLNLEPTTLQHGERNRNNADHRGH